MLDKILPTTLLGTWLASYYAGQEQLAQFAEQLERKGFAAIPTPDKAIQSSSEFVGKHHYAILSGTFAGFITSVTYRFFRKHCRREFAAPLALATGGAIFHITSQTISNAPVANAAYGLLIAVALGATTAFARNHPQVEQKTEASIDKQKRIEA